MKTDEGQGMAGAVGVGERPWWHEGGGWVWALVLFTVTQAFINSNCELNEGAQVWGKVQWGQLILQQL